MAKNKEFVDANNGKIKQGDRHRVYPPVGKFLGGITRPKQIRLETEPLCILCGKIVDKEMAKITKPFVYIDELRQLKLVELARKHTHYYDFEEGKDAGMVWLYKAAAKIARERK